MNNPFAYSNCVSGKSFCNREKEQKELLQYIESSQNVLLYSHRRYGKSSLIFQVFENIKKAKLKIGTIHVDLYGTTSEKDFITRTFQGLSQIESNFDRLLKRVTQAVKGVRFQVEVNPMTGNPTFSPSFESVKEDVLLLDLMQVLDEYAKKKKLVVAFDEFQEISTYSGDAFEKRLRSCIQQQKNICYIFSGSQQHLLTEMFNTYSRAFYKQAASFPLKKISADHYVSWAKDLFQENKIRLEDDFITYLAKKCENHPMYVQQYLFFLWDALKQADPTLELIDEIESSIIEKKSLEYMTLWESLTLNQKKTLKLVILNEGKNLYSVDALKSVDLKTASLVTKTSSSLIKKDVLAKNGVYAIQDVLFKRWIEQHVLR